MRNHALVAALLGACLASSCESSRTVDFFQTVGRDSAFPGTPADRAQYQHLLDYVPDPACVPRVTGTLDRETEIRIFRGNGITDQDVVRFGGGLRRYYDQYGLTMYTRYGVLDVPIDHAMVLNEQAILDHMAADGVDPACLAASMPSTACSHAMGNAMFFNVKQFLKAYAEPAQNIINVVLLKRVASLEPSRDMFDMNWGVGGLGLSEELVNSGGSSDVGTLAEILNESDFSPTVFIAVNLTDFVLQQPDVLVAHEVGHAYGLEHVYTKGNLMYPVAEGCSLSLDTEQLAAIERTAEAAGNLFDANHYDPLDLLSFGHRAPEILSIVRQRIAERAAAERGAL